MSHDPVIDVAEFSGRFAIGVKSDLFRRIASYKEYEPDLVRVCLENLDRNRDAIDIGANVGFYSVLFAKHLASRRVLAIEPTLGARGRLQRNLELNEVKDRVVLFEGVAANRDGVVEMKVVDGKEEYSSMGGLVHPVVAGQEYTSVTVPMCTVDSLVSSWGLDPGFVKIDVEGMEHLVLQGMQDVLSRLRPVVISELSDPLLRANGSSSTEVVSFIRGFNYEVVDPIYGGAPAKRAFGDILCVPRA